MAGEEMNKKKKKLDSDLLRYVKWDNSLWDNSLLRVTYHDGTRFIYKSVPESVYQKILSEPSAGAFWLSVRDHYDFVQVH